MWAARHACSSNDQCSWVAESKGRLWVRSQAFKLMVWSHCWGPLIMGHPAQLIKSFITPTYRMHVPRQVHSDS